MGIEGKKNRGRENKCLNWEKQANIEIKGSYWLVGIKN